MTKYAMRQIETWFDGAAVSKVSAFVLASCGGAIDGAAPPMAELHASCARVAVLFAEVDQHQEGQEAAISEARAEALRKVSAYLTTKLQPIHANVLRAEEAAAATAAAEAAKVASKKESKVLAAPKKATVAPKKAAKQTAQQQVQQAQQAQREKRRREQANAARETFLKRQRQDDEGASRAGLASGAAESQQTPVPEAASAGLSASDRLVAALKSMDAQSLRGALPTVQAAHDAIFKPPD